MVNPQLQKYVQDNLKKGYKIDVIRNHLLNLRYSPVEVDAAIRSAYPVNPLRSQARGRVRLGQSSSNRPNPLNQVRPVPANFRQNPNLPRRGYPSHRVVRPGGRGSGVIPFRPGQRDVPKGVQPNYHPTFARKGMGNVPTNLPKQHKEPYTFDKFKSDLSKTFENFFGWFGLPMDEKAKRFKIWINKPATRIVILIFVILLGLLLFLYFLTQQHPPIVHFKDSAAGKYLVGDVYMDDDLVGYTQGIFTEMPWQYCLGQHSITLENDDAKYVWDKSEEDCDLYIITLNPIVPEPTIHLDENIIFNFTNRPLNMHQAGMVYFDDKYEADVNGEYLLSRQKCQVIKTVKLVHNLPNREHNFSEWNLTDDNDICRDFDVAKFAVD